jgi:hypothetical protein
LAGYLHIHLPSQLDNSMRTEVKHKERRGERMELTQKEKDRLAELKAKEVKDAKSLTVAEQAELKALKAKK